jgi:hypothetical protein
MTYTVSSNALLMIVTLNLGDKRKSLWDMSFFGIYFPQITLIIAEKRKGNWDFIRDFLICNFIANSLLLDGEKYLAEGKGNLWNVYVLNLFTADYADYHRKTG